MTGNEKYTGSMEWRVKKVTHCWNAVIPVVGLQKQWGSENGWDAGQGGFRDGTVTGDGQL